MGQEGEARTDERPFTYRLSLPLPPSAFLRSAGPGRMAINSDNAVQFLGVNFLEVMDPVNLVQDSSFFYNFV